MSWFGRQLNKLFSTADFTPTYTPSGSMTYTSVTTTAAKACRKSDNLARISLVFAGTVGGTPSTIIDVEGFPDAAAYAGQCLAARVQEGSTNLGAVAWFGDVDTVRVKRADGAAFSAGAVTIGVSGEYEI